jgi:hypothetical protein
MIGIHYIIVYNFQGPVILVEKETVPVIQVIKEFAVTNCIVKEAPLEEVSTNNFAIAIDHLCRNVFIRKCPECTGRGPPKMMIAEQYVIKGPRR